MIILREGSLKIAKTPIRPRTNQTFTLSEGCEIINGDYEEKRRNSHERASSNSRRRTYY